MRIDTFWKRIGMPAQIRDAAARAGAELGALPRACALLFCAETGEQGYTALRAALGEDEDGMKMLFCLSRCAARAHGLYRARGIPEEIYTQTMEFLSRFAESDFNKYGRPCFRWGWWFYRQLALLEFRIGALEYEMTRTETGARALSLHIPAGADLSRASLCASLRAADAFFAEFFPQFDGTEKYCDSWLLSPVLPALLPQDSHILQFQSGFEIVRHDPSSSAALDWIFPDGSLPPERLPEGTLLQKKVKALLLAGGSLGCTLGRLRKDAWQKGAE